MESCFKEKKGSFWEGGFESNSCFIAETLREMRQPFV